MAAAQATAEMAVSAVGCGYDLAARGDLRFAAVKPAGRIVDLSAAGEASGDITLPGGIFVSGVPSGIVADKGELTRFRSDVVPFHQMTEHFNQFISLSGKIPSGFFNAMFDLSGCWKKDGTTVKALCYEGCSVELYRLEASRSLFLLCEHVRDNVPHTWNPAELAEFIAKYGTHVIVGVKIGGKDVICLKQHHSSELQQNQVQSLLKKLADENFHADHDAASSRSQVTKGQQKDIKTLTLKSFRPSVVAHSKTNDIFSIHVRRGGDNTGQSHKEWLQTINLHPDVISMSFVPIASLLTGVQGSGFLSHAVNLYIRYKPPLEELQQFLDFQLPRHWAPAHGELSLGPKRKKSLPALQFSLGGPKLQVNTVQVDIGNRPVTGVRLYLEGHKNDRLAIHLQHLEALPSFLKLQGNVTSENDVNLTGQNYFEPVKSALFSHVCTAPVQCSRSSINDSASIVTRAWLEVRGIGVKRVLFLGLGFCNTVSMRVRRSEWEESSIMSRKSGSFSRPRLISGELPPSPSNVETNSGIYPGGPPVPLQVDTMSRVVDTTELTRGPDDQPGYWVVTGAKLKVVAGRISIQVKFSLLSAVLEENDLE